MGDVTNFDGVYKNKTRLDSPQGVMRALARTTNMLLDGKIEEQKARAVAYMCNVMLGGFKIADFEARLEKLETELKEAK